MNKRKKIALNIAFVAVVGLAGAAGYIVKEYNRKHPDTASRKADFRLAVTALVQAFETDEAGANTRYLDKVIRVEGPVRELAKDEKGFYTVVLGDSTGLASVRCSMDSLHNPEAAALQPGAVVALKGICTGFNKDELLGSDVILFRCALDKQ